SPACTCGAFFMYTRGFHLQTHPVARACMRHLRSSIVARQAASLRGDFCDRVAGGAPIQREGTLWYSGGLRITQVEGAVMSLRLCVLMVLAGSLVAGPAWADHVEPAAETPGAAVAPAPPPAAAEAASAVDGDGDSAVLEAGHSMHGE